MNKAVLITGASTGIGRAVALFLDREGYHVFATVRRGVDAATLTAEASDRFCTCYLDVTDTVSICELASELVEAVGEKGLFGLVNNAGIVESGPLEFVPIERLRHQLDVNVTGHVAVTQAMLPLLRKAQGRIINIGSVGGLSVLPFAGAYCASKFALEAITDALRMELHGAGIDVVIIEPASIATPIWDKALEQDISDEAAAHYGSALNKMMGVVGSVSRTGLAADAVARVVHKVLTTKRPRTRYLIGRMAYLRLFLQMLPDRMRDRILLRRFTQD